MNEPGGRPVKRKFRDRHRWTILSTFACVLALGGIYAMWGGDVPGSLAMTGLWFALIRIVVWVLLWTVFFEKFTYQMIARWADTRTADVVRTERFRILSWMLFAELTLLVVAVTSGTA